MRVEVSVRATADLKAIADFIGADQSIAAAEWFAGLIAELESLATLPDRGAPVTEHLGYRQIFFGNKPHVYRIIYRVHKQRRTVFIFRIRHGARHRREASITHNLSKCNAYARNCLPKV